jgi:carbon storage regulator
MLVISRRKGQSVTIGDEIELVVTELHRSTVKLGIRAPRGLAVLRGEIRESIEEANRAAAASSVEAAVALADALPAAPEGQAGVDITARRHERAAKPPERARRVEADAPAPAAAAPSSAEARRSGG